MILYLDKKEFNNDMFTQITEGGCILTFNVVKEHCKYEGLKDCYVDAINIEVRQNIDGEVYYDNCPVIIGMSNKFISIDTEYKELLGQPLTIDNIEKCSFNVSDFSLQKLIGA